MSTEDLSPTRVALYMRASTEQQKYSVAQQATLLTAYAASAGYIIVASYIDDGRSGLTLAGRRGLQALLAQVVGGTAEFSRVLILDVSRWGRFQDPDEAAHYEYLCHEGGVAVDYCHEAFENGPGAMAALVKNIKRIMAAEFSRELSERVRFAKRQHALAGYKMGGGPHYGFRRLQMRDGKVVQELGPGELKSAPSDHVAHGHGPEEECETIREIFRMYVEQRLSMSEIGRRLRARGVGRGGRDFVGSVLNNELVTGVYAFRKVTSHLGGPRRRTPDDEVIRVPVLPALVTREMFERAQQIRRQNRRKPYQAEELLKTLRDLLAEHQYLSSRLIKAHISKAAYAATVHHFGSMARASTLAGYPWYHKGALRRLDGGVLQTNWRGRRSDEEMIAALKRILAREGRLTFTMLRADPDCAAPATYQARFGSLPAAYALAGYGEPPCEPPLRPGSRVRRLVGGRWRGEYNAQEILSQLRPYVLAKGRLTQRDLASIPDAPSRSTLCRVFGTLENVARRAAAISVAETASDQS